MKALKAVVILAAIAAAGDFASAADNGRAAIEGGEFRPLYSPVGKGQRKDKVRIQSFLIDKLPVTNAEFRQFIAGHPGWQKGVQPAAAADAGYLRHWDGSGQAAAPAADQLAVPVVNISWFAANDFCVARGGRLPTVDEWEFVAAASETERDASGDPKFAEQILRWYSQAPAQRNLAVVGSRRPNAWGVYDLHGLVWEWNEDFNSVFVNGDNRRDGEGSKNLYCGDAAVSAADKQNYAAFMRYAFRNSLRANYTTENLGFRCAYDH